MLVLVVVAVLGLAGLGLYRHYHQNHANNKTSTTGSSSAKVAADVYAGWKTYWTLIIGYCFRYPTDWTVVSGPQESATMGGTSGLYLMSRIRVSS